MGSSRGAARARAARARLRQRTHDARRRWARARGGRKGGPEAAVVLTQGRRGVDRRRGGRRRRAGDEVEGDGVLPHVAEEEEEGVAILGSTLLDPVAVVLLLVVVDLQRGYPMAMTSWNSSG